MIWEINQCSIYIARNKHRFVIPVWLTVLFIDTHIFPCTILQYHHTWYLMERCDLQPAF